MITKETIKQKTKENFALLLDIRHHLHQHPELSFQESETAEYISKLLTVWGIKHQTGVGGYGIVGIIKGNNPDSKTIALRADTDALPITEQNQVAYKSLNTGLMHACGHDVHTTCLLGTAKMLQELRNEFEGTVKLIFQPAEEVLPGGAKLMIAEGVLENPVPQIITGQHVFPEMEVGKVGFKTGYYMASSDEINLYVRGNGGHAAIPNRSDDTVLAAAQVIVSLQKIASRNAPPAIPTVLSFGKIIGNGLHNVFPVEVAIHGTFRTFSEEWRAEAHQLITETAQLTAKAFGVECDVVIDKGYPAVFNNEPATLYAKEAAIEYLGKESVVDLDIRMTAEDFGRFAQMVPGCFYRLGTANEEKGITSNLHTPTFDVDEQSIEIGTGVMTWLALKQLELDS
jgi:amidohydrolase